ncbi:MAG: Gfo/Idh/MocA family protein [Bryobacteraceae bacterium]
MHKVSVWLLISGLAAFPADLRLGLIGADTSHTVAFTNLLNNPSAEGHVPGARVVAAYKGESRIPAAPANPHRADRFAAELESKFGIEIVPDIATLCKKVDAVLLESNDGRLHLKQAKEVIAARKPMFIDKPLAATLEDAREIARLAAEAGVPWFSSSGHRFSAMSRSMKFADATSVVVWGASPLEPLFPLDLAWYGIHSIEGLYTLMGPGCEEVTRVVGRDSDVITGRWKDGRTGVFHAMRTGGGSGAVVFRPKAVVQSDPKPAGGGYEPLVREIVKFFQTRTPPVPAAETLEIVAFMDAAQRSKAAGGQPMRLR